MFNTSPVTFTFVVAFELTASNNILTTVSINISDIFLKFFIKRTLLFSTNITIIFALWYAYSI